MSQEDNNLTLLNRYLLGELSEDEQAQVEERFFEDAEFLEELRAVECDVIDSYVRGELTGARRERFESRYLASPDRRRQVLFADALAKTFANKRVFVQPEARPPFSVVAWLNYFRRRPLLVVTAIAVVALGSLLIWQLTREPRPSPSPIVEDAPPPEPATTPPAPAPDVPVGPAPRPGPSVATLVLKPQVRGERGQALVVTDSVKTVRLVVDLASDDYAEYNAELLTPESRQTVWKKEKLKSQRVRLSVEIPADRLRVGNYILAVSGATDTGEVSLIAYYYFGIAKQ